MSFGTAVATCFAKFATFSGRARRSEYWYFTLFVVLLLIAGFVVDLALGTTLEDENGEPAGGAVFFLIVFAILIPGISVAVRRLHDLGRSGWWYWIQMIPFVGGILFLIWMCTKGTTGDNDYGPDPLGPDVEAVFG